MARHDTILQTFLKHRLLVDKYHLTTEDQHLRLREALTSDKPIVKTIALIVQGLESSPQSSDQALRITVTNYLNEAGL
ncbi:hypothetical protein ACFQZX_00470 [Mucilaginibacter litoreus]|uniref:Uncharacterized protein n=1 Tax=Mucilaginibacter litoreus TaxID=1048221 RepID=A0ABW3AMK5_9SPHI